MALKIRCTNVLGFCIIFVLLRNTQVKCSKEVMFKLTQGFAKVIEACRQEVGVGDHIMKDFYNFWKEDYELLNREFGCTIMCVASKFDMITDDMQLHRGNAHEVAKKHGADDDVANKLVDIIHDCDKKFTGIKDDCNRVLEVTKCFRTKIHELNWAPGVEVVIEEVLTEV